MTRSNQILNAETVLVATTIGVLSVIGWYWYQRRGKRSVPKTWEPVGRVKKLFIYPLKSGQRIEPPTLLCTEFGVQVPKTQSSYQFRDRNFLVYKGADMEFRTARQYPKMIFIKISSYDEDYFTLNAPDMETINVKIPSSTSNKTGEITLHKGEKIFTIDCGDEVAKWISQYVLGNNSGLRLGYHDAHKRRDLSKSHGIYLKTHAFLSNEATGLYSDLSSFLLINQASVDELNSRIPETNITAHNFRPNILIEGPNAVAYSEDNWKWVKIGNVILYTARPCTRCVFTTIDPETGVFSKIKEPLRTMAKYRQLKQIKNIDLDGNVAVMGINMGLEVAGEISVGDTIYVGK